MDTVLLVLVLMAGVAALSLLGLGAWRLFRESRKRRRRADHLRERFGPEYDRVVALEGIRDGADALETRIAHYGDLDHPSLSPHEREDYTEAWRRLQCAFVESPERSVREAEHLVVTAMEARGFPTADGAVRADALSVEDPGMASSYRVAHRAFCLAEHGRASVDQLLGAVLVYRELLEQLLDRPQREATTFDDEPPGVRALAHVPAPASTTNR